MKASKPKYAVFTMDVEALSDTDCLRNIRCSCDEDGLDGFDRYITLLDRHGIRATLFTLAQIAPRLAERLRSCIPTGHRIALHGLDHTPPMSMTPEQFRTRLRRSKRQLSRLLNVPIEGYRAPCFSLDRQRLDVLQSLGFRYDSSYLNFGLARHTKALDLQVFSALRQRIFRKQGFLEYGLSGIPIPGGSFPLSGGGYLRMLPWFIVKPLLKRCLRQGDFYVFYLHPFELSRRPLPVPRQLRWYDRFYLRYGISSFESRIEKIIDLLKQQGYQFVTFEELTQILNREEKASDIAKCG